MWGRPLAVLIIQAVLFGTGLGTFIACFTNPKLELWVLWVGGALLILGELLWFAVFFIDDFIADERVQNTEAPQAGEDDA